MQFFSSNKCLQEIFFKNHPPPPSQELNGRPLKKPGKASETSTTHNSSHNVLNMACQQVMNKIQFVLTNVEKRVIN